MNTNYTKNFLNTKINAAFPIAYFYGEGLENLTNNYSDPAPDAGNMISTLYLRQDNEDPESRRAAGVSNESPTILTNDRMLIIGIFPSLKIWNAIQNSEITDIEIISDENLLAFIEDNKIVDTEE